MLCWNVFQPGGGIYKYDPAQPEQEAAPIFHRDDGVVFDMCLSFDARKIVFSWMSLARDKPGESDSFHVYEINLDGSGLRQLTDGPYHDVHPIYLPGGRIGFVSTRVESYQMCQPGPSCALYEMNAEGGQIRRLEFGTLGDYSPCLMDDGRILFTRWEYQDKSLFTLQSLWTINPDGSRVSLFYGNTITTPNVLWQARPIPGTDRFVCTLAPHHKNPVGAIAILDRQYGLESPRGIRNLTPDVDYHPTLDPALRGRGHLLLLPHAVGGSRFGAPNALAAKGYRKRDGRHGDVLRVGRLPRSDGCFAGRGRPDPRDVDRRQAMQHAGAKGLRS